MFNMDSIMTNHYLIFHHGRHSKMTCEGWNQGMITRATKLTNQFSVSKQVELEFEEEEEVVTSDEAPIFGHVINMYQCLNAS